MSDPIHNPPSYYLLPDGTEIREMIRRARGDESTIEHLTQSIMEYASRLGKKPGASRADDFRKIARNAIQGVNVCEGRSVSDNGGDMPFRPFAFGREGCIFDDPPEPAPRKFKPGDRVVKNPTTWETDDCAARGGSGVGAGEVVACQWPLGAGEVKVRWPSGNEFYEQEGQLLPAPAPPPEPTANLGEVSRPLAVAQPPDQHTLATAIRQAIAILAPRANCVTGVGCDIQAAVNVLADAVGSEPAPTPAPPSANVPEIDLSRAAGYVRRGRILHIYERWEDARDDIGAGGFAEAAVVDGVQFHPADEPEPTPTPTPPTEPERPSITLPVVRRGEMFPAAGQYVRKNRGYPLRVVLEQIEYGVTCVEDAIGPIPPACEWPTKPEGEREGEDA